MTIDRETLMAYHDGALPPEPARAVEQALASDPAARALLEEWRAQDAALGALYAPKADEPVPERLRQIVRARPARAPLLPRLAAAIALVALGGLGGWGLAMRMASTPDAPVLAPVLAQDAINAYQTFVVEVVHPVEVEASQAAHLVGWVSKRLGHDIAPPDFAARGFRLMGGRVLPGADGPAAMFMYENDLGQRVSLYVAPPARDGQTAFQFTREGEVQSFWWVDGDLSYAVVGKLPRDVLRTLAVEAYDQLI